MDKLDKAYLLNDLQRANRQIEANIRVDERKKVIAELLRWLKDVPKWVVAVERNTIKAMLKQISRK